MCQRAQQSIYIISHHFRSTPIKHFLQHSKATQEGTIYTCRQRYDYYNLAPSPVHILQAFITFSFRACLFLFFVFCIYFLSTHFYSFAIFQSVCTYFCFFKKQQFASYYKKHTYTHHKIYTILKFEYSIFQAIQSFCTRSWNRTSS